MRQEISYLLLVLSAFIFAVGSCVGGYIWLLPDQAVFFAGLNMVFAVAVASAGNFLSFLLNLVAWGLGLRRRWLKWAILVQSPFALLVLVAWIIEGIILALDKTW